MRGAVDSLRKAESINETQIRENPASSHDTRSDSVCGPGDYSEEKLL